MSYTETIEDIKGGYVCTFSNREMINGREMLINSSKVAAHQESFDREAMSCDPSLSGLGSDSLQVK